MVDSVLVTNISELITLEPLTSNPYKASIEEKDLGIINDAWLIVRNGKIESFGEKDGWKSFSLKNILHVDAKRSLVLPGLVDSHTHILYGGDRSEEFSSRLEGKTYAEIASAGGGDLFFCQKNNGSLRGRSLKLCSKTNGKFSFSWGDFS